MRKSTNARVTVLPPLRDRVFAASFALWRNAPHSPTQPNPKQQWDGVENKASVLLYLLGAAVLLWLSDKVVGAVEGLPVVSVMGGRLMGGRWCVYVCTLASGGDGGVGGWRLVVARAGQRQPDGRNRVGSNLCPRSSTHHNTTHHNATTHQQRDVKTSQIPKVLELVGLVYVSWFSYRYLLFRESREELAGDVEALKDKITGGDL